MTHLFADTSGWGNLVDLTQPYHTMAVTIYRTARQQGRKIVTTNYIITELVALMTSPLRIARPAIIAFIESLKASPCVEIIHVNMNLDEQAWQLFKSRQDKEWSLTDCVSFMLMKQRSIMESLTTDYHFEQAEFIRLLK